jgi:anti-anti-sigma factor
LASNNGVFVIELKGEFDLAERTRLDDALAAGQTFHTVVLNLHETTFTDSTLLQCIIQLRRRIEERNGRLILVGLRPQLRRLFELCSLETLFDLRRDLGAISDLSDDGENCRLTIESRVFSQQYSR